MNLKLEEPRVPNFVLTDKGKFSLADLSDEEFTAYKAITIAALNKNRSRQETARRPLVFQNDEG